MSKLIFAESKDVAHKKIHRKKGYRGHKQEDNAKDVIPTPPPSTPTPTPTPSTTLKTEDVDLDAQSAEDMRKEAVSTETTGNNFAIMLFVSLVLFFSLLQNWLLRCFCKVCFATIPLAGTVQQCSVETMTKHVLKSLKRELIKGCFLSLSLHP